ncbi:unnamed protein product, partial [Amoebophrya sp. A120]|eukprot:GSA120T00016314001.1
MQAFILLLASSAAILNASGRRLQVQKVKGLLEELPPSSGGLGNKGTTRGGEGKFPRTTEAEAAVASESEPAGVNIS